MKTNLKYLDIDDEILPTKYIIEKMMFFLQIYKYMNIKIKNKRIIVNFI